MVSAWHVGGTRGLGIMSSEADVLWMSVVRGLRGLVEYVRCVCVWVAVGSGQVAWTRVWSGVMSA